ncbi:MAG: hypothetical protein WD316_05040 [Phycisphaeraceae bacterium]
MFHSLPRLAIALLVWPTFVVGVGCASSSDFQRIESTHDLPVSVSVIESLDGTVLWHIDVPPEHELRMQFQRGVEGELLPVSGRPATRFGWSLHDESDRGWARLLGQRRVAAERGVDLPGRPVVIELTYHEPGGFPSDPFLPDADDQVPPVR